MLTFPPPPPPPPPPMHRELYRYTTRSSHTDDGGRGTSSDCSLPSLVDIGKCTAEEVNGAPCVGSQLVYIAHVFIFICIIFSKGYSRRPYEFFTRRSGWSDGRREKNSIPPTSAHEKSYGLRDYNYISKTSIYNYST